MVVFVILKIAVIKTISFHFQKQKEQSSLQWNSQTNIGLRALEGEWLETLLQIKIVSNIVPDVLKYAFKMTQNVEYMDVEVDIKKKVLNVI